MHRSLAGLRTRKYERTGEQQHQAVSNTLASSVDIPYVTRMTVQLLSHKQCTLKLHRSVLSMTVQLLSHKQCTLKLHRSVLSIPLLTRKYHCHPYMLSTTVLSDTIVEKGFLTYNYGFSSGYKPQDSWVLSVDNYRGGVFDVWLRWATNYCKHPMLQCMYPVHVHVHVHCMYKGTCSCTLYIIHKLTVDIIYKTVPE